MTPPHPKKPEKSTVGSYNHITDFYRDDVLSFDSRIQNSKSKFHHFRKNTVSDESISPAVMKRW